MLVLILTIGVCVLVFIMKSILDYPGLLSFKCVYGVDDPEKPDFDLSEYELAAIDLPTEIELDDLQETDSMHHHTEVGSQTSDVLSEVVSDITTASAASNVTKYSGASHVTSCSDVSTTSVDISTSTAAASDVSTSTASKGTVTPSMSAAELGEAKRRNDKHFQDKIIVLNEHIGRHC